MSDVFNFKADCGLPVIFIKREEYETKYVAIGTRYGSSIREFSLDGSHIITKSGLAHFLEHKLFRMPDGSDALERFTEMNAYANAFTQKEKTTYYFTTEEEFDEPLKLLLTMYFTPYFKKEDIDNEKGIILSEYNETVDDTDFKEYQKEMQMLYPKDDFSEIVIGSKKDIKSTTPEDLYEVYQAFYTPENSRMVIVGDLDEKKLMEEINKTLAGLTLSTKHPVIKSDIRSKHVRKPEYFYTYDNIAHLLGRIDALNYDDEVCVDAISGIFNSILSTQSNFFKMLVREGYLLDDNIDFSVSSYRFTVFFTIDFHSKKPEEVIKMISDKLHNFTEEDLNDNVIRNNEKHIRASYLYSLDSIHKLGARVMDLALENKGYQDMLIVINREILKKYIPYVRNAELTHIISKK